MVWKKPRILVLVISYDRCIINWVSAIVISVIAAMVPAVVAAMARITNLDYVSMHSAASHRWSGQNAKYAKYGDSQHNAFHGNILSNQGSEVFTI